MALQGYVVEVLKKQERCTATILVRPGIVMFDDLPEARLGDMVELEAHIFVRSAEPEGRPANPDCT